MSRLRDQRGSALTMTLMAAALLLPLGALSVFVARTGLLIQQNVRSETDAFYRVEAGLEWAMAALPPDIPPALLVAGPDGVAGTADDGRLPVSPPLTIAALLTAVDVRAAPAGDSLVRLTATGTGVRQTTKTLEQLARQRLAPYAPGAVYLDTAALPTFSTAPFVMNGYAHARTDPIGSPTVGGPPLPAVAFGPAAADAVVAGLPVTDPTRFVGQGGPPSIAATTPLDLNTLAARAAARPDAVIVPAGSPDATLGDATAPRLSVVAADARIDGIWQGAGVLVVRGRLTVSGTLDFAGLVLATNGLVVEPGGQLQLHGSLWLGQAPFDARGTGGIGACPACLAAADAAVPGLLPHPYEPCGWREVY